MTLHLQHGEDWLRLRIDIYHHFPESTPDTRLDQALDLLRTIITKETSIMATLDDTLALMNRAAAGTDSLIALFEGLKQQLADVLAGVTLPPGVQEKVDAVFSAASANVDKVEAEIAANPQNPAPA